jgi:hypothetical protein
MAALLRTSHACSALRDKVFTTGSRFTPMPSTPRRCAMREAGDGRHYWTRIMNICSRSSSAPVPKNSASRMLTGQHLCSKRRWQSVPDRNFPTIRSAGPCGGWTTCGSDLATPCNPIRCARKKRRIRRQVESLPRRSVVLAQDESDLLLFPPLRSGWSKRGAPATVWLTGRNARRVIFGVLNLRSGTRLFVPRLKGRSADFQAFLAEVRSMYRGWHVALLLDEDPSHTAKASLRAAAGMTLLWLPKRSPKLNPMETLWGQGKDVISADKQYATIEEQVNRFLLHLCSLSDREALNTSGVLSKRFWLRRALSNYFCGPA